MLLARLVARAGPGCVDAHREFLRIADVTEMISEKTRWRGVTDSCHASPVAGSAMVLSMLKASSEWTPLVETAIKSLTWTEGV